MNKCPNCGYDLFPMDTSCEKCGQIIDQNIDSKNNKKVVDTKVEKNNGNNKKNVVLPIIIGLIVFIIMIAICVVSYLILLEGDKVKQTRSEIELGSPFYVKDVFECKGNVNISLKEGYNIDTLSRGTQEAVFIITSGKKFEEKSFSFNIVDTIPPIIEGTNFTIYSGDEVNLDKFVQCSDNSDEEVSLSIKSGVVDSSTKGDYPIVIEATDTSGNTAEKSIIVTVMSIDSPEDVMDLIDEFLTKEGYSEFKYNRTDLEAVFITSPKLKRKNLSSERTFSLYPEIFISESLVRQQFGCNSLILRGEVTDENSIDNRYKLKANNLKISSGDGSILMPEKTYLQSTGDFEKRYYTSRFDFEITNDIIDKFENMVDSGNINMEFTFTNEKGFYPDYTYENVTVNYECSSEDIEQLKRTLAVYRHMQSVIGNN